MNILKLTIDGGTKLLATRRNIALMGVAMFTALLIPLGFVQQANAAESDCTSGRLCLWYNSGYSGLRTDYYSPSYGCHNVSSTFNDQISSISNHLTVEVTFFKNANCPSTDWPLIITVWPGIPNSNLSGSGLNDEITSFFVDYL